MLSTRGGDLIDELKAKNAERWRHMTINHVSLSLFNHVAASLSISSAKIRYETVANKTGVPWFIIAVIHEREASQSWAANLAQGDPWNAVSTHIPKHQGPFASWEQAAINALTRSAPYAAHNSDWTPGGALTLLEQYNGLGYANGPTDLTGNHYPPQPSPYLWAGTNQYHSGKYVADRHFDPHAIDRQLGCAGLIAAMALIDPSVKFT